MNYLQVFQNDIAIQIAVTLTQVFRYCLKQTSATYMLVTPDR